MDTPHGRGKRFGLGSRQGKVWPSFRRNLLGDLFFTCSLQALAPAVGPEKRPGDSAFSMFSMIGRNVEET
jgi:hypothetical protein